MKRAAVVVAATIVMGVVVAQANACGDDCRTITVKDAGLTCSTTSTFTGEIHFDDAATYQSFLLTDCLPDVDDDTRQKLVDAIDFTKDAVFVAVGLKQDPGGARCIQDRKDAAVEVCGEGLRVDFNDQISDANPCPGKWTVAFALPRAELRAALLASPPAQPVAQ